MTRSEMLKELTDLLADTAGADSDRLATNTRKLAYLSEGQEQFCEDTGFFMDATTFTIPTVAGTATYAVDNRVIKVMGVSIGGAELIHFQHVDRPSLFGDSPSVVEARPAYWQMDEQTDQLRVYPVPNEVYTLTLRAWRFPLTSIEEGADPELPSTLQRACIEWAAYKILNHHDAELRNKAKATEHYDAYQMYVDRGIKHFRRRKGTQSFMGGPGIYTV